MAAYGAPELERGMTLWDVPSHLEIGAIPKRLYCSRLIIAPLVMAFDALIKTGAVHEIKTWDGCFNIRQKRSGASPSLHSWGVAFDINASWNRMGQKPTMPQSVVKCFKDAGFDWGGDWNTPDGMHFQLSKQAFDDRV
jgi:hypothetical protein